MIICCQKMLSINHSYVSTYVLFIQFSYRSRLNVSFEYILVVSCTSRLKFNIDVDLYSSVEQVSKQVSSSLQYVSI